MEKGSKGHSKGHESKGGSMGVDAGLVDTTHIEPWDDSSTQKGTFYHRSISLSMQVLKQ